MSTVADYARDGAVCLRGLLDAARVERLRNAVAWLMEHPGPFVHGHEQGDGGYFGDMFMWRRQDDIYALTHDPAIGRLAAELMGAARAHLLYDHMFVKDGRYDAPTPWHHDLPYWPFTGTQIITFWFALDPVSLDNGAVEFVRGSHRPVQWYAPASFGADDSFRGDGYAPMPDVEARRAEFDIVHWDLQPGDALAFDGLTLHGAPANKAGRPRRALAIRYAGEDVRFDPRPGTSGRIRSVAEGLGARRPGDDLYCPAFPVIWPAA